MFKSLEGQHDVPPSSSQKILSSNNPKKQFQFVIVRPRLAHGGKEENDFGHVRSRLRLGRI
jgi:hypothetical protein